MSNGPRRRYTRTSGFTLIELLVVITIILLVSVLTLPTVIPALSNRQVSEGARILQGGLAGARDAAIRYNAPRGIRLLPDPTSGAADSVNGATQYYNRYISIEPAPDLNDDSETGSATFTRMDRPRPDGSLIAYSNWADPATGNVTGVPPIFPFPLVGNASYVNSSYPKNPSSYRGYYPYYPVPASPVAGFVYKKVLLVEQSIFRNNMPPDGPNPPTSWFWNVRVGDRIRFNGAGHYYTVVGPMTLPNPELFVNDGPGLRSTLQEVYFDGATPPNQYPGFYYPEYLFLVNGIDDDGDGYIDNGVNGVNENLNFAVMDTDVSLTAGVPIADDIDEWTEKETYLGNESKLVSQPDTVPDPMGLPVKVPYRMKWTISRRPVPSASAQEVSLPGGAVIDATTWDSVTPERSRLPVDPNSFFVDIMLNPTGQVIPTTTFSNPASVEMRSAFLHFWVTDRSDVYEPNMTGEGAKTPPFLPIPQPPAEFGPYPNVTNFLKKDRQLVTLFARSGQITTGSIEEFDFKNAFSASYDANLPFDANQLGNKEAK